MARKTKFILISPETHHQLREMGRKSQTFDDVIQELIFLRGDAENRNVEPNTTNASKRER